MPVKNRPVKKSSANVLLLGIVSFVNDVSSEMVMPILPMFITSLGGAGLAVGVVGGLRDSVSSILKVLCGYWSDRIGNRKAFVYSGYLISLIFKVLLAFSRIWQHALFFSTCERVGKGVRTSELPPGTPSLRTLCRKCAVGDLEFIALLIHSVPS